MDYIIGVDFDNTLISYDDVIYKLALERGLIDPKTEKIKKDIRDKIRQLPDGEIEWQKIQANVYGPGISDAVLIKGVSGFFRLCREYKFRTFIVSHKTDLASHDETGIL